jgi:hypothetical protein
VESGGILSGSLKPLSRHTEPSLDNCLQSTSPCTTFIISMLIFFSLIPLDTHLASCLQYLKLKFVFIFYFPLPCYIPHLSHPSRSSDNIMWRMLSFLLCISLHSPIRLLPFLASDILRILLSNALNRFREWWKAFWTRIQPGNSGIQTRSENLGVVAFDGQLSCTDRLLMNALCGNILCVFSECEHVQKNEL